jgi:hypothetical protein
MTDIGTLARLVDLYWTTRQERLAIERQAEEVKEREMELKAQLMELLVNSGANGVAGSTHRVTLRTKLSPQVTDWSQLYAYIRENDAFDLLQRRLSAPAFAERKAVAEVVPGVAEIEITDLSVNKL